MGCETTRSKDASTPKGKGVSAEDCIGMTVVSTKEITECGETIDDSEPEGPSSENQASGILAVAGHKRVRWFPLQVLQRNLALRLKHIGFSIVWMTPAWLAVVGDMLPAWLAEASRQSPTWLAEVGDESPTWLAEVGDEYVV
jgi:hypothetical protein